MVWAMDQVDQSSSNDLGINGNVTPDQRGNANQMARDQLAGITCRSALCGSKCPKGSSQVTETNGQPGQLSTSEKCPKGKYQPLCCDHGTSMGKCQWRGFRGAGLSCISGCADGETEVTTNKNNHGKKGDQTCNGGVQSYCCAGFKPAPTKEQLAKAAKDAAKAAAESAAEQAALDVAAKAFCRVAVPALLAPLELLEDLIPIFGEIADIAEIAATPAIIQGCVKGIEKEGKAEFKIFGKKHTLSMDKPSEKPTETRPPGTSHETPKTSTQSNACNLKARGLEKRAGCNDLTRYTDTTTFYQTIAKVCTGKDYTQACFHYQSAIKAANNPRFNPVTCSEHARPRQFLQPGPALKEWSDEHDRAWLRWMRRPAARCERDEWPPNHFWQGDDRQLIRYNVSTNLLSRLMPKHPMLWASKLVATLASISIRQY